MDLDDVYRIDGYLSGKAICSEIIKRADDPNIIYRTNDMVLDTDAVKELAKYITRLKYENESLQKTYDDCYCKYKHYKQFESISVQKVKDKIEEVQKEYNKLDKQVDEYINDANKDLSKYYENKEKIGTMQTLAWVIDNLQELLEGRE